MIPERDRPGGRRTDVDGGDYIDLFLDDGYDDEFAREDSEADVVGWRARQWAFADGPRAERTDSDLW